MSCLADGSAGNQLRLRGEGDKGRNCSVADSKRKVQLEAAWKPVRIQEGSPWRSLYRCESGVTGHAASQGSECCEPADGVELRKADLCVLGTQSIFSVKTLTSTLRAL